MVSVSKQPIMGGTCYRINAQRTNQSFLVTRPLPGTKACLPILPYMLAVFIDYSVNIPLTDHLNLVPKNGETSFCPG